MPSQTILRSLQAFLFCPDYVIDDKLAFTSAFVPHTARVFSKDPQVLSSPAHKAPNAPLIEIHSPDRQYHAAFLKDRIILHFQDTQNTNPTLFQYFPVFYGHLTAVVQGIMEFLNPPVLRLGFIIQMIRPMEASANAFFSEQCFQNQLFTGSHEIHLNLLHKIMLQDVPANRWVRYRTLRAKNDPAVDRAMALEVDLNTMPENQENFSAPGILDFYQMGFEHLTGALPRDFPLFDMRD